jgi:hypothetical protein
MERNLPPDELSTVLGRIQGLLLTEEKVDRAAHLLARAIKESIPGTIGAGDSLLDSRGRRTRLFAGPAAPLRQVSADLIAGTPADRN